MPEEQSPMIYESPRERNKYRVELRVFDGNMNETREQAVKDFERHYGYNPVTEMQEVNEAAKSPDKIRDNV